MFLNISMLKMSLFVLLNYCVHVHRAKDLCQGFLQWLPNWGGST